MSNEILIKTRVNGVDIEEEICGSTLLVDFLRETLHLTGTKIGCGMGECGACTVLMDGTPVNSCLILAAQAHNKEITTIEGIRENGKPTELQKAFVSEGAVQCGFCTPGFIMSATALLKENPSPSENEIRTAVSGNLCRCTGYKKIVDAIKKVSSEDKEGETETQ